MQIMFELTEHQREFVGSYKLDCNVFRAAIRAKYPLEKCQPSPKYFIYALVDPVTDEIFYVGKGKNKRWLDHERLIVRAKKSDKIFKSLKVNRLLAIIDAGLQVKAVFLAMNIEKEADAYALENAFINGIGIEKLTNATKLSPQWLARLKAKSDEQAASHRANEAWGKVKETRHVKAWLEKCGKGSEEVTQAAQVLIKAAFILMLEDMPTNVRNKLLASKKKG